MKQDDFQNLLVDKTRIIRIHLIGKIYSIQLLTTIFRNYLNFQFPTVQKCQYVQCYQEKHLRPGYIYSLIIRFYFLSKVIESTAHLQSEKILFCQTTTKSLQTLSLSFRVLQPWHYVIIVDCYLQEFSTLTSDLQEKIKQVTGFGEGEIISLIYTFGEQCQCL